MHRLIGMMVAAVAASGAIGAARPASAASPQPYTVGISDTGQGAVNSALQAGSQLVALRTSAPVGPFGLVGRARLDRGRLLTVLKSFGYYRAQVRITIDGHALDEPSLVSRLQALPNDHAAQVRIGIVTGPQFHLREVRVEGPVNVAARAALRLQSGAPAIASDVLAAQGRLLTALRLQGYALARVPPPVATLVPGRAALDVTFTAEPGPKLHIGPIRFEGLKRVHERFLRRNLALHAGQLYDPVTIARARTSLLSLGVFRAVSAQPAPRVNARGTLPITFIVQERPLNTVSVSGGYSTDLGGSASLSWTRRNLFGNAEQLSLTGSAINWGGTATHGLGDNLAAQLLKPDFLARNQSLQASVTSLRQYLTAYTQTAQTESVSLARQLGRNPTTLWSGSVGINLKEEHILQEGSSASYLLLALPVAIKYDSTGVRNPLHDVLHGARLNMSLTPTQSLGRLPSTFFVAQVDASTYFDLARLGWTPPGRTVIALRALLGQVLDAHSTCLTLTVPGQPPLHPVDCSPAFNLPPDQRFYGGGTATVRGYAYQSVGPQFPDGNPAGGTAIDAAGIELRQRLLRSYGVVLFSDIGQVSAGRPFQGVTAIGYGVGGLYYTPIGTIRLDVGFPARPTPHSGSFQIYIGLGQAF